MSETLIKQFYTSQVRNEWRRLVNDPYHHLELDTTLHFLEKYLPEGGLVLDAGGGPGRYTLEMAGRGHGVVLLDLSLFADHTFDAVVCTGGPLSQVLDPMDRDRAVSELIRVAKAGAPLFISVISRLAVLVFELARAPFEIELPLFKPMRDTGDYQGGYGFTCCHFFLPEELRAAVAGKPVEVLEMVGLEGISSHHRRALNQLAKNEKRWGIWLETHYQTCTHPVIAGISEHMLLVCRKN